METNGLPRLIERGVKIDLRTLPRSIRGARKKGWHVVKVPDSYREKNVSWLGLEIWAHRQSKSFFVCNFAMREFAFKSTEDATWFTMKWCL